MRRRAVTPPGTADPRPGHLQPTIPPPRDWRYAAGSAGRMVRLTGLLTGLLRGHRRGSDARCFARRSSPQRRSAKPGSPTSGPDLWLTRLCPRTAPYVSCATRVAIFANSGYLTSAQPRHVLFTLRIFWTFPQQNRVGSLGFGRVTGPSQCLLARGAVPSARTWSPDRGDGFTRHALSVFLTFTQ
jgi:hypothetical protein